MLRKISIAVVTLVLLSIPLLVFAQPEKPEPQRLVGVTFNSHPDFTEVRVDGVFIGTTPLPYRLTTGVHKIELSRRGFQTWTRELYVSNNASTNVTALLDNNDTPCPK